MEWYWVVAIAVGSVAVLLVLSNIFYKQFFKRFYDVVLSGIALIVLSPLLLILTIAGAIAMHGNPFFVQPRPGKIDPKTGKERIFSLVKFRTMSNKKDSEGNLLPDSVRLNKYGKFLRRTSLDELPELFSIIIGDMSIVGPRPQLVRDMVFMTPEQRFRHTVRPGLTGLAQIRGRNAITWENKLATDLFYIKKITMWDDLKIIFKTIGKVFKSEGITEAGEATATDLGDYLLKKGEVDRAEFDSKQCEANELMRM